MQTNIAGASGKVNYFETDPILTNHNRDTQPIPKRLAIICLDKYGLFIETREFN
jgi:hypothetical protein